MTSRLRLAAAIVLTLLALSYHVPLAIENIRMLVDLSNVASVPFGLEPFGPIVSSFGFNERPNDLFKTDRILYMNDEPIRSRSDYARMLHLLKPDDALTLVVEHYPRNDRPWRQSLCFVVGDRSNGRAYVPFLCGVVFPALFLILAFLSLYLKLNDPQAWVICGLLLFFAQIAAFSPADPYVWPGWLQFPALLFHNAAAWTGAIWIFLLLLMVRGGTLPRLLWFHWIIILPVAMLAAIVTLGALSEGISYAASDFLRPVARVIGGAAVSLTLIALTALFLFFAFMRSRNIRTTRGMFWLQWLKPAMLLGFAPLAAAFGPACMGIGKGFDPTQSMSLFISIHGPLMFFPFVLVYTFLNPPTVPFLGSLRFGRGARADRAVREICSSIPDEPASVEFLDPVVAGIARVLEVGRVVVFWRSEEKFVALRSYGYAHLPEYEFSLSGSLADALRVEIRSGKQRFDWRASPDEELKLHAMHLSFYIPLESDGELHGFLAFETIPGKPHSDRDKQILASLSAKVSEALRRFLFKPPSSATTPPSAS
jgi:hypothetical protein